MSRWWIDEPVLMGSGNPTDSELEQLRSAGFTLVVSLLDETKQEPRYDLERAAKLGLKRENIGVEDFQAPSLAQLSQFVDLVKSEGLRGKTLVHCQAGIGRTGTAAAAYWIAKGVPFSQAVARTRAARPGAIENRGTVGGASGIRGAMPGRERAGKQIRLIGFGGAQESPVVRCLS